MRREKLSVTQSIESVETVIVDLPLRRLQRFSAIGAKSQSAVMIFIKTKDGVEGVGESVTPSGPWWGGEAVETIKAMIDAHLAPLIVGLNAFDRTAIANAMDEKVHGNAFAKAGIEMALWDIQGKALGLPVHDLLGGKARDSLPMSWPLATGDPKAEIDEAEEKLDKRLHRIFKFKMGAVEPEKDVARAVEVMTAIGDRAKFRADPNERWDETTANWAVPRLAEAGLEMIEQPLPRWNVDGAARLTRAIPIAHMLDEGVCSVQDMLQAANRRSGGLTSIKLMKSKGIQQAKTIADISLGAGIPIFMGTFLETSYGTGANMQLCATFRDLPYGGELAGPLLLAEDICATPADYRDFELHLQDGVGLGVDVDPDKLKAFRRDRTYTQHGVGAAE